MRRSSALARTRAHACIYSHPLRDQFLDWADEHESVVDELKRMIEELGAAGAAPVEDATLIQKLRANFEDVREEWAPLFVHLLVWEFPEVRHHLKRDAHRFAWLREPQNEPDDSHNGVPEQGAAGEGGEPA